MTVLMIQSNAFIMRRRVSADLRCRQLPRIYVCAELQDQCRYFAAISYLSGHKIFAEYLNIPYIPGAGEVGIYACAIAGACLGFLWHNCEPASLFMGDTGSLSLGGALSLIAIMLGQQMLLFIIGGVFIIELASSFIQEKYYRWSKGKRVFLKAPLHHHYEKKGMPDSKIVIRFWIIAILFALIGLTTLKLR